MLDEPLLVRGLLSASERQLLLYQLAVMDGAGLLEGVESGLETFIYGATPLEGALALVRPRLEERLGVALAPSFSFLWRYQSGSVVDRHRDRRSSGVVATVQLAASDARPWPFHVQRGQQVQDFEQGPGDAIVIAGTRWPHWRGPCASDWRLQLVFSFVRATRASRHRFDGRAGLGLRPLETVKEFDTHPVRLNIDWRTVLDDRYLAAGSRRRPGGRHGAEAPHGDASCMP